MNKFINCDKSDCTAYRVTASDKGICIALAEKCKGTCVFYKSDPDGSKVEKIENDIKIYSNGGTKK